MAKTLPPISRLHELFICNAELGTLSWREKGRGRRSRSWAGFGPNNSGYFLIFIDGQTHRLHRVIFAMAYGRDPVNEIDHIDGNRTNNSVVNLREATPIQNRRNMRGWGKFGKGVGFDPRKKTKPFYARIHVDGRLFFLGTFGTALDARAAYKQAAINQFGEFATIRDKPK